MLILRRRLREAVLAHARRDHPEEACGVLPGPAGSSRPERFVPLVNAARSRTGFAFDPTDLLTLYRELDERGEDPVVVYHSHTAAEAFPSPEDAASAAEPRAHYLLVSTRDPDVDEVRSFRIVDGVVTEEEIVDEDDADEDDLDDDADDLDDDDVVARP